VNWPKPPPAEVLRAMQAYLANAYGGEPPPAVRARRDTLRGVPEHQFYECPAIEKDPPVDPARYRIRLGNRFYPHMKMVIERSPDGRGYLFRADTHDQHCCPDPHSGEYAAYCKLMEMNQKVAQRIESAWAEQQLPTFKTFLKQDLARRREAAQEASKPPDDEAM
jgi:hypothetical protein